MKRQIDAIGDPAPPPHPKEPRTAPAAPSSIKQRRAVPPGYLHDLLHSRHMMKTVGLKASFGPSHPVRKPGPIVAVTNARLAPLATSRPLPQPLATATATPTAENASSLLPPKLHIPGRILPSMFEIRKKFLQKKRRRAREETPYQQRQGHPIGLLSMPEDVLLKIVCYLGHEDIKPMFSVCKQLRETLEEAIKFHFNYATPSRGGGGGGGMCNDDMTPTAALAAAVAARRPERRRAVTAVANVMAHLRQRNVRALPAPRIPNHHQFHHHHQYHAQGPTSTSNTTSRVQGRVLSFTPQGTPMSRLATPLARQLKVSPMAAYTPRSQQRQQQQQPQQQQQQQPQQQRRTPLSVLAGHSTRMLGVNGTTMIPTHHQVSALPPAPLDAARTVHQEEEEE